MTQNIWAKLRGLNDDGILDVLSLLGGKLIWVDGANGSDANYGTKDAPIKTLDGSSGALARAVAGRNDVVVIKNSGGLVAESCVRVNAAFDWNKACTHIVAQSPVYSMWSPRASIRPDSATTAFANFFTVSARGCLFHNIAWVTEFTTGHASSIPLTITAPYNRFNRCHIAGMIDAVSAAGSGARCVKIGAGENLFEDCVIGVDTIDRSAANANIEFYNNCARNHFRHCIFPIRATGTTPLMVKVTDIDRVQFFEDCTVWNFGTATIAGLCTIPAAIGGYLAFKNLMTIGAITGYGTDADSRGQIYITGPTDGSTHAGIGYNPSV
jgi:hypothetical protein